MRAARFSFVLFFVLTCLAGCAGSKALGPLPVYLGMEEGEMAVVEAPEVAAGAVALAAAQAAAESGRHAESRRHLKQAAATLEAALEADPYSRRAAELLGAVFYYQDAYGRGDYRRCRAFLEEVLDVDPDAEEAALYLAYAAHGQDDGRGVITYTNYVQSLSLDPERVQEMIDLRRPYQETFLGSWYDYENYYESKGAKLTRFNPETYQLDLVMQVTPAFERDMAAKGFQQLSSSLAISQDEDTRKYVQALVDRLAARTPGPPFTYRVDVVEGDEVNAMALPGRILVYEGLLAFAENEAELVAILSHELAHVYAHHSARQMMAAYKNRQLAATLLSVVRPEQEIYQQLLVLGTEVGLELVRRGYSRRQEKEADRYGTHIAFNAGYNPTFMTGFFLRLYEANPRQPIRLLSTHPPTTDRLDYTTAYLEQFPLEREMQIDSEAFKNMKQRLR